jgi:hypothetical protein
LRYNYIQLSIYIPLFFSKILLLTILQVLELQFILQAALNR